MTGARRPPADCRLLAFDCAAAACSAAVWACGRVVSGDCRAMARGQVEALMPMVEAVMREAGMGFADLDGLAATVGPGSFTGVRVGLAAARGLALATGLPVIAMTTFEAIAAAVDADARADRMLAVAIDAKRGGEVYFRLYGADGGALTAGSAVTPAGLAASIPPGPLLVAGDAQDAVVAAVGGRAAGHPVRHPDARAFVAVAAARLAAGAPSGPPVPVYLRAPDVTLPPVNGRAGP